MNNLQMLGMIRHGMTFLGGMLVTKGIIDESFLEEFTGSIITIIGGSWSMYIKLKNNQNNDKPES